MPIDDLWKFALLWLHKTEEVRANTAHYGKNTTGDIYESGWISEMYGYSFGAAELKLRHQINGDILIYLGYVPESGVKYRVFHYRLEFKVGNWSFNKANWRNADVVNKCWGKFPDPPNPSTLEHSGDDVLQRDLLSIECAKTLNEALRLHHERRKCPDPSSLSTLNQDTASEAAMSRKFGKIDTSHVIRSSTMSTNVSQESSVPAVINQTFSSFRFWIICTWASAILGFFAIMYVILSRRRGHKKKRGKSYNPKRRFSYSRFVDTNGHNRHLAMLKFCRNLLSSGGNMENTILCW